MGALKGQLIRQFLVEAAIVNLLSVVLALVIVGLVMPFFNSFIRITTSYSDSSTHPWFLMLVFSLWIIGTMLSGSYPALVLSSFKPVTVLKGKLRNIPAGIALGKSLVVFQFMALVALIDGMLISLTASSIL